MITPYPYLDTVLQATLAAQQHELGNTLTGLIVHGSLALGDFNPERSDIDLIAVTDPAISAAQLPALTAMHARVREQLIGTDSQHWAGHIECSYIPRGALRRYDPSDCRFPALHVNGTLTIDEHGPDWILLRHVAREHGIALAGPAPRELIDPVAPQDLRRSAVGTLRAWWAPMLVENPAFLATVEYQAYAAMTMARILYTVENLEIVSKSAAVQWAMTRLPERYTALLSQAAAWPHGPQPERLGETIDFIRYVIETAA